jgi:hypothetical protein
VERLTAHCDAHAAAIQQRDATIAELDAQLRQLGEQLAASRAEIERLNGLAAEAMRRSTDDQHRIAELAKAIADVRTSTSWRLTGPMRAVADSVKSRSPRSSR